MRNPLNIQLAIQGGGAKICALLATMEALEGLQGKDLRVTRIAGTSAGSIVACMFAAGIPMDKLKSLLTQGQLGEALVKLFAMPSYLKIATKAYRGNPFWDTTPLERELETLFKAHDVHYLKDLTRKKGVEVIVIAADIRNAQKVEIHENTPIVKAIMDSCGLPYCFRTWKQGYLVDGGICENLPIEVLATDQKKYGPITAISFAPTLREDPKTMMSFSMALLDTAMNNAINRAKALLPTNHVFEIKTSISTFDFARALTVGLNGEYGSIRADAKNFFDEFVKFQRRELHHVAEDPWNERSATLQKVIHDLGRVYQNQHAMKEFEYTQCDFIVQANCLLEDGEIFWGNPDVLTYELTFKPSDEPLYCVSIGLSQPKDTVHLGKTSFELFDNQSRKLPIEYVPMANPVELEAREVLIFFTPALPANSGPYKLRLRDQAIGLMSPLKEEGTDELAFYPRRAKGSIGRINLVLHVPDRIAGSTRMSSLQGRAMTSAELQSYQTANGFHSIGWTGVKVEKPGPEGFKADITIT